MDTAYVWVYVVDKQHLIFAQSQPKIQYHLKSNHS